MPCLTCGTLTKGASPWPGALVDGACPVRLHRVSWGAELSARLARRHSGQAVRHLEKPPRGPGGEPNTLARRTLPTTRLDRDSARLETAGRTADRPTEKARRSGAAIRDGARLLRVREAKELDFPPENLTPAKVLRDDIKRVFDRGRLLRLVAVHEVLVEKAELGMLLSRPWSLKAAATSGSRYLASIAPASRRAVTDAVLNWPHSEMTVLSTAPTRR
jgi:hypothetical protein